MLIRDFLMFVTIFVGLSSGQSCQSSTFRFPNAQQISDYVVYNGNVPELNEITVCGAVEATLLGTEGYMAILSYAVQGDSNELLLIITADNFRVWIRGDAYNFGAPFNLKARKFHFCVTISTVTQQAGVYLDGQLTLHNSYTAGPLRPDGILLVGQDRDNNDINGFPQFDSSQALSGTISNLYIWSRVLDASEIQDMAQKCSCPSDHVINFQAASVHIHGDVAESGDTCSIFFTDCQPTTFHFPSADQVTDYVRYMGDFPGMDAVTACAFLNSNDTLGHFVFSYAAGGEDNELSLAFKSTTGTVRIWHQGTSTDFTAVPNVQAHLCFTLSILASEIVLYVDGFRFESQVITDNEPLKSGGHFVLGQDHDAASETDQEFRANQAYVGDIANVIIWSRVLSASEIFQVATGCPCPKDASILLTEENTQRFGSAGSTQNSPGVCPNGKKQREYAECSVSSFEFPVDNQITDYVQLTETFPDFHEFTYCAWNSPTSFKTTRSRYHFSYSSFNRSNELLLSETADDIRVLIKNTAYVFSTGKSMNATRHICVIFSTFDNQIQVFVDGELSGSKNYTGSEILGGGRLVLGNDQDGVSTESDLELERLNAWSGVIQNPTIWSRVLTPTEISDIANDCRCPNNPTIFIGASNFNLVGAATNAVPDTCTTVTGIEFCAPQPCANYAACDATEGGYNCSCEVGFDGDGITCSDVDECEIGTHDCDVNAACSDTTGSFTCTCNAGFIQSGSSCADINECTDGPFPCSNAGGSCTNTDGSFNCICQPGYSGDGFTCEDLNECTDGSANCDSNAGVCTNTNGSFTCACGSGYEGDGTTCEDIDECTRGIAHCSNEAGACTNTNGSFSCYCAPGYSGDGITCEDLNECTDGTANCDNDAGICTNTNGSFTCACSPGYEGDGMICEDIDECITDNGGCGEITSTNCLNTDGGFECSCQPGYSGNPCTREETTTPAPPSGNDNVVVQCSANEMRLSLPVTVVRRFSSHIGEMYLRNGSCPPTLSPDNTTYHFVINGNLANECDTQVERNDTHIIYKNEVASHFDRNQPIITGSHFNIPFQCAFPAVGNIISINYTVVIATATVLPPGGGGAFQLSSQLFTNNLFDILESQRSFQTTDFLFVEIGIDTQDGSLTAVLNRCWATPTADLNDVTQYNIITDSCPVPRVIDGSLQIQSNGESRQARFQVQAFAFADEDQLYLHCEVTVCDLDTEICAPTCSGNRKRRGVLTKSNRQKRQAENDVEYQTIGPIYRLVSDDEGTTSNALVIGGVLGGVVVVLVAVLVVIAVKVHAAGVIGGGIGAAAAKNAILSGISNVKGVDNPAMMT